MEEVFLTIGLAFMEGIVLIASPCILPILPIILAGSLTGHRQRPIGIVVGFVLMFIMLTLFLRFFLEAFHVDADVLRYLSYLLLGLFGLILFSDALTKRFNKLTQHVAHVVDTEAASSFEQGGWFGGLVFGSLLALIWTPCAGPILAAALIQSVLQETTLESALVITAFSIGAGVPMLLIALFSRSMVYRLGWIKNNIMTLRKLLGFLIILSVLFSFITLKTNLLATPVTTLDRTTEILNGLENPYPAPNFVGIDAWINSSPLTVDKLRGKVVLVDFWTFSCINCIRTLPYLKEWYAKYHDKGFEIIGVHSPEFSFEKNIDTVKKRVKQFDIHYPVAIDNQFLTWKNYHNQYWPAHYLIDQSGQVVYQHAGEGEYDVTENNIRFLLGLNQPVKSSEEEPFVSDHQTPEIYLGYARSEFFADKVTLRHDVSHLYQYTATLEKHYWTLKGNWIINNDKIVSASASSAIKLNFTAAAVYAVMGTKGKPIEITIKVNHNDAIHTQKMTVKGYALYTIASFKRESDGIVELIAHSPGLEIYTFTFGS